MELGKDSEVTKKTKLQKEKGIMTSFFKKSTRKATTAITKKDFTKFFVSGRGSG